MQKRTAEELYTNAATANVRITDNVPESFGGKSKFRGVCLDCVAEVEVTVTRLSLGSVGCNCLNKNLRLHGDPVAIDAPTLAQAFNMCGIKNDITLKCFDFSYHRTLESRGELLSEVQSLSSLFKIARKTKWKDMTKKHIEDEFKKHSKLTDVPVGCRNAYREKYGKDEYLALQKLFPWLKDKRHEKVPDEDKNYRKITSQFVECLQNKDVKSVKGFTKIAGPVGRYLAGSRAIIVHLPGGHSVPIQNYMLRVARMKGLRVLSRVSDEQIATEQKVVVLIKNELRLLRMEGCKITGIGDLWTHSRGGVIDAIAGYLRANYKNENKRERARERILEATGLTKQLLDHKKRGTTLQDVLKEIKKQKIGNLDDFRTQCNGFYKVSLSNDWLKDIIGTMGWSAYCDLNGNAGYDSLNEAIVACVLILLNIRFVHNKRIPGQKGRRARRYDFYLPDYGLYIEVWMYKKANGKKRAEVYLKKRGEKMSFYNHASLRDKLIEIEAQPYFPSALIEFARHAYKQILAKVENCPKLSEDGLLRAVNGVHDKNLFVKGERFLAKEIERYGGTYTQLETALELIKHAKACGDKVVLDDVCQRSGVPRDFFRFLSRPTSLCGGFYWLLQRRLKIPGHVYQKTYPDLKYGGGSLKVSLGAAIKARNEDPLFALPRTRNFDCR